MIIPCTDRCLQNGSAGMEALKDKNTSVKSFEYVRSSTGFGEIGAVFWVLLTGFCGLRSKARRHNPFPVMKSSGIINNLFTNHKTKDYKT